jgi:hypothetical protein
MLLLDETVRGWRMWCKTCALPSFAADHVLRSALCLKLHAYVDTGAIGALLDVGDGHARAWIRGCRKYEWTGTRRSIRERARSPGKLEGTSQAHDPT